MEPTVTRPRTKFNDRQIPYYERRQPQYKKEKSMLGRIGFIIYYISIISALTIIFLNYDVPLTIGIIIVSYLSLMFVVNYSKFNVKSLSVALVSGLISIILLINANKILGAEAPKIDEIEDLSPQFLHPVFIGASLAVYIISSLHTVYTAELKDIISLNR